MVGILSLDSTLDLQNSCTTCLDFFKKNKNFQTSPPGDML